MKTLRECIEEVLLFTESTGKTTGEIRVAGLIIPKGTTLIGGANTAHFVRYTEDSGIKLDPKYKNLGNRIPRVGSLIAINRDEAGVPSEMKEAAPAIKWVQKEDERKRIPGPAYDAIPTGAKVHVEWNDEIASMYLYNDFKGGIHLFVMDLDQTWEWKQFKNYETARKFHYEDNPML